MGSKAIQSHLWGQRPQDWANIQEQTANAAYQYVLDLPELKAAQSLLDVGCGSGLFCSMLSQADLEITGIDASDKLLEEAKKRAPGIRFVEGEMESLPFESDSFDIVCGFNSFQYAANVKNALTEARRVLKNKGKVIVLVWGNKEDCEAAIYLKAVGSMLPPPPPGAPGPFALSENDLLRNTLEIAGFRSITQVDIPGVWDYPDTETALKGLLSAGPAAKAIEHSGYNQVFQAVSNAVEPYIQANGQVVFQNKFRIAVAEK